MKLELENADLQQMLQEYISNTFTVPATVTGFKVVAGRTGGESRIELDVNLGSNKKCIEALPVEYAKIASLDQLTGEATYTETDEEEEIEDDLVEPSTDVKQVEPVEELKHETTAPLTTQVKATTGSFFGNRAVAAINTEV